MRYLTQLLLAVALALGLSGCSSAVQPVAAAPADPPQLKAGGDPRDNSRALQHLIDHGPDRLRVEFGPGQYEFADAVKIPASRVVTLDGKGVAQLYRTGYREMFVITPAAGWERGKLVVCDFWAISGRITTEGTPQVGSFRLERTDVHVAADAGYGLDFATGYSGPATVRDCTFYGGGLRWVYGKGAAEPHATSLLLIDRVQVSVGKRHGPDIHLRGCQMCCVRQVVCQGVWEGYAPGVNPADTWRTKCVLIEAPGPRGGRLEDVWCELWGDDTAGADVRVHNPFRGSGGAYGSRDFELTNVTGWGRIVVSAHPDALNAPTVASRGGSEPVGEGPVVIKRWLTHGLEERAVRTRQPVWVFE